MPLDKRVFRLRLVANAKISLQNNIFKLSDFQRKSIIDNSSEGCHYFATKD